MKTIVLVGGGHSHLYCLLNAVNRSNNLNIILISPSVYQYYSGMFSGFAEGIYQLNDIRINLEKLCQKASITFIQSKVNKINPMENKVYCESGQAFEYDVISFDIGSMIKPIEQAGQNQTIKPNYRFVEQILNFRNGQKPVIIGGGASGVELALSVLAWRKHRFENPEVTIVSRSPILSSFHRNVQRSIIQIVKHKGLKIVENEDVVKINKEFVLTSNEQKIPYTNLLTLTGPKADVIFRQSDLPTDQEGFLMVNNKLQCINHPNIFGAGDCIHFSSNGLPKNGVYAVRQGPILWKNIMRYLNEKDLYPFKPQKRYISILSTGNKEGLFTYDSFYYYGKMAWKLKNFIDTRFIQKFNHLNEK